MPTAFIPTERSIKDELIAEGKTLFDFFQTEPVREGKKSCLAENWEQVNAGLGRNKAGEE